ncbi:MAG: hopanoid biosynthesis-associated protein HpnK [Alphaproteobacteria bacterium]|nr:hopanoid biosynthesis-associated protein HpnK [Alphaproteobacteria bacterium]
MKHLIVTADDFGLSLPVNEAVETAFQTGILTGASLMVGAPAAADAVARAWRLPGLGVGLHLVLINGRPVLPPEQIPELVGPDGRFPDDEIRQGVKIFLHPAARRQMEAEVRAQFEAFRRTGLPLDYVDGHHHFHQHPSVLALLIALAREYDFGAVRLPYEPFRPSWRAQGDKFRTRLFNALFHWNRTRRMKARLRGAGLSCNDAIFGLNDSGGMGETRIRRFLEHLPDGVSELYCHPATCRWDGVDALRPDYQCVEEFAAVSSPALRAMAEHLGVRRTRFGALTRGTLAKETTVP